MSASKVRATRRSPAKADQMVVYLAPGQPEEVRKAAARLGVSVSEFARRAFAEACADS